MEPGVALRMCDTCQMEKDEVAECGGSDCFDQVCRDCSVCCVPCAELDVCPSCALLEHSDCGEEDQW